MNLNSDFFKTVSTIADFLTLVTVISAIPFALLRKNENLLAFKVSRFLHYILRTAFIILAIVIIFQLAKFLYFIILLSLKGSITDTNFGWESGYEFQHIVSYFISTAIGLSLFWIISSFLWTSSFNKAKDFLNLFLPKGKLLSKQQSPLEILSAIYKTSQKEIDVTPAVRQRVVDNKLTIMSSNEIAGDPDPGVVKTLVINYRIGRNNSEVKVTEGDTLTIPIPI